MEEEAGGELDGRLVDRAKVESCLDAVRGRGRAQMGSLLYPQACFVSTAGGTDAVCSVSTGLFCIYGWVIAKVFHSGVIGF